MSLIQEEGLSDLLQACYLKGELAEFDYELFLASKLPIPSLLSHDVAKTLILSCEVTSALFGFPHPDLTPASVEIQDWPRVHYRHQLGHHALHGAALFRSSRWMKLDWAADLKDLQSRLYKADHAIRTRNGTA